MGRRLSFGVERCASVLPDRMSTLSVFNAWGMSVPHAVDDRPGDVETDLRGVDLHGISMLPPTIRNSGQGDSICRRSVQDRARGRRPWPHRRRRVTGPSRLDECHESGRRQVPGHRGGGGVGVQLPSLRRRGLLREDRGRARCDRHGDLGNPWDHPGADVRGRARNGNQSLAFALPPAQRPFQLDMVTITVAAGKVKVYRLNYKPVPVRLGRRRRRSGP